MRSNAPDSRAEFPSGDPPFLKDTRGPSLQESAPALWAALQEHCSSLKQSARTSNSLAVRVMQTACKHDNIAAMEAAVKKLLEEDISLFQLVRTTTEIEGILNPQNLPVNALSGADLLAATAFREWLRNNAPSSSVRQDFKRLIITSARLTPPSPALEFGLTALSWYAHGERPRQNLLSAFEALAQSKIPSARLASLRGAFTYSACRGHALEELLPGLADFHETVGALPPRAQEGLWRLYHQGVRGLCQCGAPLDSFTRSFTSLIQITGPSAVHEVFVPAALFTIQHDPALLGVINLLMQHVHHFPAPAPMLAAVKRELEKNNYISPRDLINSLQGIASHGIAKVLQRDQRPQTVKSMKEALMSLMLIPEKEQDSHHLQLHVLEPLRRVWDIFHGFGALAFEARRGPNREPPLLARFGQDTGRVTYLNAQDIDKFPGRGMIIDQLKLDRILVADPTSHDPYAAYRKAWPGLAPQLSSLSRAAFALARGMVIVAAPGEDFTLKIDFERNVHYGLIICNDHFHNPGCASAFLVPVKYLGARLRGTLIGYEDYTGVSTAHRDINRSGLSPRMLEWRAFQGQEDIINVGRGTALLRGLADANPSGFISQYHDLRSAYEQRLAEIRSNERNGGRHNRENRRGRAFSTNLLQMMRDRDDEMLYMDDHERQELVEMHGELRILHRKIDQVRSQRREENSVTKILTSYLNLIDLFRISLSLWHKGHTAGGGIAEPGFTAERTPVSVSSAPAPSLIFDRENEAAYNPFAIRMLQEAYSWHSGRARGIDDPGKYPILASAATLEYSALPDEEILLDTFSMKGFIKDTSFQLTYGVEAPEADDVMMWWNNVMPRVKGTTKDLRFYDRKIFEKKFINH